ncbi:MAG: lamin tail domain-containing protein [Microthrixaceae bacterium]|nr:lamin tail domain-containing protein [Microthrixaceae bacterium]
MRAGRFTGATAGGALIVPQHARSKFLDGLADRRAVIANNTGPGKPVPGSQAASAAVVVNETQYAPNGGGGEFIELTNPGTTTVDISGWTIDAVGLTVQPGTVGSLRRIRRVRRQRRGLPAGLSHREPLRGRRIHRLARLVGGRAWPVGHR